MLIEKMEHPLLNNFLNYFSNRAYETNCRKFVASVMVPFLFKGITFAILSESGKYDLFIPSFKKCAKN